MKFAVDRFFRSFFFLSIFAIPVLVDAKDWRGLAAESPEFCQAVQQLTAQTSLLSVNTVFVDMASYRHSKPAIKPLTNYQVVSYWQGDPMMISCKVKAADHIRAEYGNDAAGEQLFCFDIAQKILNSVINDLSVDQPVAAQRARQIIIDKDEPYFTGRSYLQDFSLSTVDESNVLHIRTPGLLTNWDNVWFSLLPDKFRGQLYCHLPSYQYLKGLATQRLRPGWVATTDDESDTMPN